jgi:DNA-binding CsgD family transcriptional regulator
VLLVTRRLKIVDQNPAAEALLALGGDIHIAGGHFAFVEKFRTAAFQAFVNGLADQPGGWAYRRPSGAFTMVRADPLPASPGEADSDLIALTIYPSDPEERYVWADFAPHFDLTRSEAVVVKRLVAGQPASTVAEELGLSIETVRTHIRRIYNKLGISSREQLFAIAGQFRLG